MYIDLLPFLNPSPYIVPEDMSLAKVSVIKFFNSNVEFQIILFSSQLFHLSINQVYNLFRQLGLRHVFVVPRASHTLGLITRKDLLIEVFFMFIYIVNDLLPKINLLCFLYWSRKMKIRILWSFNLLVWGFDAVLTTIITLHEIMLS